VKPGTLAYDTERGCVGVLMDHQAGVLFLRPIGGGVEWSVPREQARAASRTEIEAAKSGLLNKPPRREFKFPPAADRCTRPCEACKAIGLQ
jgi:hypothetical protein